MKKLLFLSTLLVFTITVVQAQIKTRTETIKLQAPSKIIEPVPTEPKTPQPPPPSTNKSSDTGTSDPLVYTLTSVRVRIKTGNDNKEFPSKVYVWIKAKNQASWSPFYQDKLDNEMKVSSETEFGLDFKSWAGETGLNAFQTSGLVLRISYLPNFFADAWKIESISLVLEFKDQKGNLHPSLGNKTIVFSNAYGFLNNEFRNIDCFTDGSFVPLTAVITK